MLIKLVLWTTVGLIVAGGAAIAGALVGAIALRRFQETFLVLFGFWPKMPWEEAPPDQISDVEYTLNGLAAELSRLLVEEGSRITKIQQVRLTFQLSLNVAAANGFETRGSYREYLPQVRMTDTQPLPTIE